MLAQGSDFQSQRRRVVGKLVLSLFEEFPVQKGFVEMRLLQVEVVVRRGKHVVHLVLVEAEPRVLEVHESVPLVSIPPEHPLD